MYLIGNCNISWLLNFLPWPIRHVWGWKILVEAEALGNSLLQSRSLKKKKKHYGFDFESVRTPKCALQNCRPTYQALFHSILLRLLSDHSVTFDYKLNSKTAMECLTLLKWICKYLQISATICGLPLWSSGQSSWLQIKRSRVRFPALLDF
jgi:hypothetical protein